MIWMETHTPSTSPSTLLGTGRKSFRVTSESTIDYNTMSNVKSMEWMFDNATSFNQPLHAPWYVVEQSESE